MTFNLPFDAARNKAMPRAPTPWPVTHRSTFMALGLLAALLTGCGTPGGTAPGTTSPGTGFPSSGAGGSSPSAEAPSPADALEAERKYLVEWFAGTPVVIEIDRVGVLRVEVPLQFAFDARQSKPKPALMKVLDRVGTSLRRVPTSRVHLLAPPDATAPTDGVLVEKRVKAVREEVVSRGVNAIRIAGTSPSTNGNVQIRLSMSVP